MAEKEYIERDKVLAELAKLEKEHKYADGDDRYPFVYGVLTGVRKFEIYVKKIPAANVVEVVRCEHCTHCKMVVDIIGDPHLFCGLSNNNAAVQFGDFCSYGERKEQDNV